MEKNLWQRRIQRFIKRLRLKFLPQLCVNCKDIFTEDNTCFCKSCNEVLLFNNSMNKDTFPDVFLYAEELFIYAKYDICEKIITQYKFNGLSHPFIVFTTAFAKALAKEPWSKKIDYIVPVPLYRTVLRKRHFNQSDIVADILAKHLHSKTSKRNLQRKFYTTPQHNLTFKERIHALKDVFYLKKHGEFDNCNILLIDDVLTSGTTTIECCKAIKQACKHTKIYIATLSSPAKII